MRKHWRKVSQPTQVTYGRKLFTGVVANSSTQITYGRKLIVGETDVRSRKTVSNHILRQVSAQQITHMGSSERNVKMRSYKRGGTTLWGKIKKLESQASESVGGLGCSSSSASNRGWALWALWAVSCWATVHCTLNQPPASNDSFEKSIWRKVFRVSLEENAPY